jgi:hypothetical protein
MFLLLADAISIGTRRSHDIFDTSKTALLSTLLAARPLFVSHAAVVLELLMQRHDLNVVVVAILNLGGNVVDRLLAAAVTVADFLGNFLFSEQQHRFFHVTEPLVGIQFHFLGQVTGIFFV